MQTYYEVQRNMRRLQIGVFVHLLDSCVCSLMKTVPANRRVYGQTLC